MAPPISVGKQNEPRGRKKPNGLLVKRRPCATALLYTRVLI